MPSSPTHPGFSPSIPAINRIDALYFEAFAAYEVVVPAHREVLCAPQEEAPHAQNISWPTIPITLVEGRTNYGFTAVGEAPRGMPRSEVKARLHSLLHMDLRTWHPLNLDLSHFGHEGLRHPYVLRTGQSPSYADAAMLYESLWVDAMGQAAQVPAHLFFGGKVRNRVRVDAWANRPTAHELQYLVEKAVEMGFSGMKLKCAPNGDTLQALTAVRNDIPPNFHFTVDAMNALRSLRESAALLHKVAPLKERLLLEDPFAYERPQDWVECRKRWGFSLACHARNADRLRWALDTQAAEVFNLGKTAWDFHHLSQIAEFHHHDCWQGSTLELGVGQMLRLHAASAARACVLPSDIQSEWVRETTLVDYDWDYTDGALTVSESPGLGIHLDHKAIPHYLGNQWNVFSQ